MYPYTPLYYNAPTQVRYWEDSKYHGGICYHDFIIKGDTGEIDAIQNIINHAEKEGVFWDDAVVELDWVDIDEDILWGGRFRQIRED